MAQGDGGRNGWNGRNYPLPREVFAALRLEHNEWREHGDCKTFFSHHVLAMEVRRLRAMLRERDKRGGK